MPSELITGHTHLEEREQRVRDGAVAVDVKPKAHVEGHREPEEGGYRSQSGARNWAQSVAISRNQSQSDAPENDDEEEDGE